MRRLKSATRHRRLFGRLIAAALAALSVPLPAAEIRLAQHGGGELVLPAPAARIITLAPHLTELAYLAGAGDQLVGTVEFSNYPDAAAALPRIGDAFRFDLERILALQPDLVIAWDSGNPASALQRLESLGLKVWRTEVRRIDELAGLLRELGHAAGHDAGPAANAVSERWAALQETTRSGRTVRYFYQVAQRPLYTVNGDHLISQGLAACGAENIFAELTALAPQIGPEAVLQRNPEVIFAGRIDAEGDSLDHWRRWPQLLAVQREALMYLPADLINRATPRLLDAVEIACRLLDDYRQGAAAPAP